MHDESLAEENAKLRADVEHYRELYLKTLEQCRKLERGILGQKREKLPPHEQQLSIAVLGQVLGDRAAAEHFVEGDEDEGAIEPAKVREHERRRSGGRRPLPESLPRVDIEILPPEVEHEGRDHFERIGEEVSETVERRPASLVVVRVRRPKFVRKDRERNAETEVLVGDVPELPIPRGLAGPGLLADTIVRRWQDHLPLNRLEQIYAREGLELPRSTVCTWHTQLTELVAPLIIAMWKDALASPYLCTDATGVLVQAKEKCRVGHFWVVVAPERHVLYAYSAKHDGDAVGRILGGYRGYLVADAHAVYDHLYRKGDVVEVGCWAHTRRYFFKALDSDPERARHALALIGALFKIERDIAEQPPGKRRAARQRDSRAIVERFFAWCDAEEDRVLDQTPIARGIGYARNQRQALLRFLDDARLPIHNNTSELALRREVVGRKNWLFVGSDDGGDVNAAFVTLLASCQLHKIEPWSYLRDLLILLPYWPVSRVLELAPVNWRQTVEQDDAQQRLAADRFRRAILELDAHPSKK